jgi:HEAT repeat protein
VGEADAGDTPSIRMQLERLLSGYHYTPDRDDLESIGDLEEVRAALRELANDADLRPSMRLRAVDAVSLYDDPTTIAFLKGLLESSDETDEPENGDDRVEKLLRHHAIMGLARTLPDDRAVERLERFLTDDDLQIRLTTITALGRHAGDPGRRRLESLASEVDDDVVRSELDEYVEFEDVSSSSSK